MKMRTFLFAAVLLSFVSINADAAPVEDYASTIQMFRQSPLVQPLLDNAYGYAVFPYVGKGAMVIGTAYGKGQVYRGGQVTGLSSVFKLSFGLQMGGQAYSEIIFFQDQRAYDDFTRGNFEFNAAASAVAITSAVQTQTGTVGNTAGVSNGPSTDKQLAAVYVKGMAVFVHVKGGFMYEASVGGQKFTFKPLK
ncbi:MAG: lipid-binding SYLF domain-containing protein [Acidiferrobacterales bacterium]